MAVIQAKFMVGEPNDRFEQEADRVANEVIRMPENEVVGASGSKLPTENTSSTVQRAHLPPRMTAHASAVLGHDFANVSVHQDGQADALGTRAFARGDELHFASGNYDPTSSSGMSLIGHELAHVAQQREGRVTATGNAGGMAANRDSSLEAEADASAGRIVQGFNLDAFLDVGAPRVGSMAAAPVVQGEDLPAEQEFQGVPVKMCMKDVCGAKGPGAANNWGLPEPLLLRFGADLPLVDVTAGTTSISLVTPHASAKLGSDGKFKLGIKDGGLSANTDGSKVEVGGKAGPVSGTIDSGGKVSGEIEFGPFKLGADSSGKANFNVQGAKLTYDSATGDISVEFTPELSWGPAKIKGAMANNGVKVTMELKLKLTENWSITIAQDYTLVRTITTAEVQRAFLAAVFDPFVSAVIGDARTFSDLLDALSQTR
jgi:hypothetical protein